MSRIIPLSNLNNQKLDNITKDLVIKKESENNYSYGEDKFIEVYDFDEKNLYVPFSYDNKIERPLRDTFGSIETKFKASLYEEQKIVKKQALQYMNETGSALISCYPAFGKTCMAINIACSIKLKTLILVHRIVLINQWKKEIEKFCENVKVQILDSKSKIDQSADFYLINAINVPKHNRSFYSKIGFLVVDEAHIIMAEKISKCMSFIIPRYVLALSATPYRMDGFNNLLKLYFGENTIFRKLFREHNVYKINTEIKIENKTNKLGKIDWNSVIESQSENKYRNELIINLIKYFKERTFLVLCKRVEQAKYLVSRLIEEKEDVTNLIGKKQHFEVESRILIGIGQKVGVGFDHPRLNSLILASDIEGYFIQYLGRVFRRKDTIPMIFDVIDKHFVLNKHFKTRRDVYLEHGGKIFDFFEEFPDSDIFPDENLKNKKITENSEK
jgi:superfamily II DNA or RNA helicase